MVRDLFVVFTYIEQDQRASRMIIRFKLWTFVDFFVVVVDIGDNRNNLFVPLK